MSGYRLACIPGDGIGKEVLPEGIRVLDAVAEKFDISQRRVQQIAAEQVHSL